MEAEDPTALADDVDFSALPDLEADVECIQWIRGRICLKHFDDSMWKEDEHVIVSDFLTKRTIRRLFVWIDEKTTPPELHVSFDLPTEFVEEILYFLRDPSFVVSIENIGEAIQYGLVGGGAMESLLRLMNGVFVPVFLQDKTWPDSIKKEFSGQLNKFMASLTETAFHLKGKTVLYIPQEDLEEIDPTKEKDLVQRLESTLIHWTRQIKEVLNNQENSEDSEDAGPLAEIEFWRCRTIDLSGIKDQLHQPGVEKIKTVLQVAKSSYLDSFNKLADSISQGSMEAQDNLKFLSSLQGPCEQLAQVEPKQIPDVLPELLNAIHNIWKVSQYYNTPERVTGLLRKVSNEIINRCCAKIALADVFDGDVSKCEACMSSLTDSIAAGEAWKSIYRSTADSIKKESNRVWSFDESSIFAQIDAFVQRCRDLLEVCEGQLQFAGQTNVVQTARSAADEGKKRKGATALPGRKEKKESKDLELEMEADIEVDGLPPFSGAHGGEITKSLKEIQSSFEKYIQSLRSLNYSILDVKATRWHDDYNAFKNGMKDLEVMMINVISTAFESVATVQGAVELLEAFHRLAKREAIQRAVEKKIAAVFTLFQQDLNFVKKDFDQNKKAPPIGPNFPRYAGAARWAKCLLDRIDTQYGLLSLAFHQNMMSREAEDASQTYQQIRNALEDYIDKLRAEWIAPITSEMQKKLHNTLISRAEDGLLIHNFDKDLLRLYNEVTHWERLGYEIPYVAMDNTQQVEKMRIFRESVLLVVRDYNDIITSLSSEERGIFHERLKFLDQKIYPAAHKVTWASGQLVDYLVRECRKHCREISLLVTTYKDNNEHIIRSCKIIAETMLVSIQKKKVYEEGEFEEHQKKHRDAVRAQLVATHEDIINVLRATYEYFQADGDDVQREWEKYTEKVDRMLEDALRQTVKRSLQEVARAVNGDSKTEVHPLFKVNVILESNNHVELRPSMTQLSQTVHSVSKELVTVISSIPRVCDNPLVRKVDPKAAAREERAVDQSASLAASGGDGANSLAAIASQAKQSIDKKDNGRESFYDVISNDEDILKIMVAIMTGMSSINDKLHKYITYWEKYKHIWDMDKDAYIRRYAKSNRPLSSYESDITRYREFQADITGEETINNMQFIRLDCSPLKQSLVSHCVTWQGRFTTLLGDNARKELTDLHNLFKTNSKKLMTSPSNLDMLADSINLLQKLRGDEGAIEARFEPLAAMYKLLDKFEVPVKEEETALQNSLHSGWANFRQVMEEAQVMLDGCKANFRVELTKQVEEFSRKVVENREEFLGKGPFDPNLTPEQAFEVIARFRAQVDENHKIENQMKPGLGIFNMAQPAYKETAQTVKDLDLLENVWKLIDEWNKQWDAWKFGKFSSLEVSEMEEMAQRFSKRIMKLGRDIKHWKLWEVIRDRVETFKRTMPLILDLKSKALRERHWKQLMDEIGKSFDPYGDDFTLEKVFSLGLDGHAEFIGTLSTSAAKELAIEEALDGIKQTWNDIDLDIVPYKDKGHYKLRSADDIFQALEDNQVTLSSMKASRFYLAFESSVNYWEKALSQISEVVEMIIQVQRQWMYLENIFQGSEDIRKQLPQESSLFDQVNTGWRSVMTTLVKTANTLKGCHTDGILDMLTEMNTKLERIQKSLDQYLETKRQAFPRFYFLSNDDLLEILGQARDPTAVQPHLKKCFEGIKLLEFLVPGKDGRRSYEATGMQSPDMEYVPFQQPVITEGPVEGWLTGVEQAMIATLRRRLHQCHVAMKTTKREKWIKEWEGQLIITAGQIAWTADCDKALRDIEKGNKTAMRQLKKKQTNLLNKLADMVKGQLTKIERLKLVALITIEIHSRDVIDKMYKAACNAPTDFEWISQLRFYWDKDDEDCSVRQTNNRLQYGYEYQGNNGRLVVTPLTDRCYMTLTTALALRRGGLPQGPAGTGKTETTKDLGKAIAKYVIVFNCSDGLDYKSLGRMFSGLAQTGSWSCFDEFNRIDVEVLSVVAQQIHCILFAIQQGKTRFIFEGVEISLNPTCGIFVTMNPGYAGRSELPENLKALLRPVSMMVPDFAMIAENMMFSEGFQTAKDLARKMVTLYSLCIQQLSKQDHYDFGLRAIKSALVAAGSLKRSEPDLSEEMVLYRTLRDMNIPKFVQEDVPLFTALLSDLFQGVEPPAVDYGFMGKAIEEELLSQGLQVKQSVVQKVIQLYESKLTRHGNMLIGHTLSGKTTTWRILAKVMTRLKKEGRQGFQSVKTHVINPKSLSLGELYGQYDLNTREWTDGVLSVVMRNACADEKPDEKWIMLDGPVDTLWIESMNTVLDDNKMLTLISGERIAMPPMVSLLFEVNDLSVASPATVSRAGMVYFDSSGLGWWPYVDSWLEKKDMEPASKEVLRGLFDKYVVKVLEFKRHSCKELVTICDSEGVISLCSLYDALATPENGVSTADPDSYLRMMEHWFAFSMIWSVCAAADEDSRKKLDMYIREIDAQFPTKGGDTVYEFVVDPKKKAWASWEEKIPSSWKPNLNQPFYKITVPTVDTIRNAFVCKSHLDQGRNVMVVGNVGVGKTSLVQNMLSGLDEKYINCTVIFSAQTSSKGLQNILEGRVEKRTKDVYAPPGGKRLITFIDDFNMPQKDLFGSHPPLELLHLWVDYGFWYDRAKQVKKYIKDMQLVAAMGPPGGGRTEISKRIQSCFALVNVTFPSNPTIARIYGTMLHTKLTDFDEDIKPLSDQITQCTMEIYTSVVEGLLPTPSKPHYVFNLRDMSKVFQGLLQATPAAFDSRDAFLRLFAHECYRVFYDRLSNEEDREWFHNMINAKMGPIFNVTAKQLWKGDPMNCFGDFMTETDEPPYEELMDIAAVKSRMEDNLEDHNMEIGAVPMDLVLFRDAIEHVCRIVRVLKMPRGNMLLIGVGGSGRQSLTRLASYIAGYKVFSIEIAKNYRLGEFHEDIKKLYEQTGVMQKATTFLFSDTQIVEETFLEDINNILSSGEVPNLYPAEELNPIRDAVRADAKKAGVEETNDELYSYFIERVRSNLHVVICLSPVGEMFRNRVRMFPGLVNCTTIDYFSEWPEDALKEVAMKFMMEIDLGGDEVRESVCNVFATIHSSVVDISKRMVMELKRHNYVTPTNYLELVQGYRALLDEKRKTLGDAAEKLRNGLTKIDETSVQVEVMSKQLEEKKKVVAKSQTECEELLVVIVQERRTVDEQAKQVGTESEKIAEEEVEVKHQAAAAQADLDEALPALEMAQKALETLNKKDIAEIKAYKKPPPQVELVLGAVMVLRKQEPTWAEAQKFVGNASCLQELVSYDKENISDSILNKVSKYTQRSDFQPDVVGRVSVAARSLCMWVRAMELYGRCYKTVAPKRAKVKMAMQELKKKQDALQAAQDKLQELTDKVEQLKRQYDESVSKKEALRKESSDLEIKLNRAEVLVNGLAGERDRWESSIKDYQTALKHTVGDCLVAAGFLSYAGPFNSEYREELMQQKWLTQVRQLNVPCTTPFSFTDFLAKPTDVRFWNIQGLPTDDFSTENGVMVTRGRRWPLMIDPQMQANKWIRNMERDNQLKVIDLKMGDFLRTVENAIQFGTPVLLQDVGEELDPSLEPVLAKSIIKQGNRLVIRLGDKDIDYNPEFKFYITTKLGNPHYTPEVSTKTTVINFAVKEQGLQAQTLGIVVKKERPDLEQQKSDLVMNVAAGKKKLVDLEDEILRLLSSATGSLLDDENLVLTLEASKTTADEVKQQLGVAEQTEKKIDAAREAYKPAAFRASLLYFILDDLSYVDPMYQYSLESYLDMFVHSISTSPKDNDLKERIKNLNDHHTYFIYKNICRGLFEKHKLLFAFLICSKILMGANKIAMPEYNFFLRGGMVMDRDAQTPNPAPEWISEKSWDNLTELDKLPAFRGVVSSIEQYQRDWLLWFRSPSPETAELPGEWESKCNDLQRMVILRCLRMDRIVFAVTNWIANNLDPMYTEPPPFDLKEIYNDSTPQTPLIFVLSSGVDPTRQLQSLAEDLNVPFRSIALGQGQAPIATRLIEEGIQHGHWVFLANCHLMVSWLTKLEKIIDDLQRREVNPRFRLWLSSFPSPKFPIAILQQGIKLTTEPPKGLKANMMRLYGNLSEQQFTACSKPSKYKRLLFGLCFFHSVLLERRKFLSLGWNIPYDFNNSDFEVCENLLTIYLDEYEEIPWDAIRYLTAEANYGGRVTDDWDRRLLNVYMAQFYCDDAVNTNNFKLSSLPTYFTPDDGPIQSYKDHIQTFPAGDRPEAFGQHMNAEIASQIAEGSTMLETVVSLQPVTVSEGGESNEDRCLSIAVDMETKVPMLFDLEKIKSDKSDDPSALHTVLFQETERYNILLKLVAKSLKEVQLGIKGLVVMSQDLDEVFIALVEGRVPAAWQKAYPSLKPLGSWMRDLIARCQQLRTWAEETYPFVYWMGGLTYPTGFLTAVLQTAARKNAVSVDSLTWEFTVINQEEKDVSSPPKDGVYISQLYLEGAGWNFDAGCLCDPEPMELSLAMPIIQFKPVESKKKVAKGLFTCPAYLYAVRTGSRERPSFTIAVDLKSGSYEPDHWVKRGTALLLALAD
eukprot:Rmarinus@m.14828